MTTTDLPVPFPLPGVSTDLYTNTGVFLANVRLPVSYIENDGLVVWWVAGKKLFGWDGDAKQWREKFRVDTLLVVAT